MLRFVFLTVTSLLATNCSNQARRANICVFIDDNKNAIIQAYCDSLISTGEMAPLTDMFLLTTQIEDSDNTTLTICTVPYPVVFETSYSSQLEQFVISYRGYVLLVAFLNGEPSPGLFAELTSDVALEAKLIDDTLNQSRCLLKRNNVKYFLLTKQSLVEKGE